MKTVIASLAAVAALSAVAAPAMAQPYGYDRHDGYERHYGSDRYDNRGGYDINRRQAQLERRIEHGMRQGDLTWREASRLRAEFRDIARLEARYRVNGLSAWERTDLDRRFDRLESRIRHERQDRDYRNDRRW